MSAEAEQDGATMKAPALTYDELKALKPCTEDFRRVTKALGGAEKWDAKKVNAKRARKLGATFADIVWTASAVARANPDVERRVRLWLADCAARVLHLYERDYPADDRPRDAIIANRACARGKTSAAAWDAAWDAAGAAARGAAGFAAGAAAWAAASAAAGFAAGAAANIAARAAAWAAASAAARGAAGAAANIAARAAASAAEKAWQFDRLVMWLSDKEPDDLPLPANPSKQKAA